MRGAGHRGEELSPGRLGPVTRTASGKPAGSRPELLKAFMAEGFSPRSRSGSTRVPARPVRPPLDNTHAPLESAPSRKRKSRSRTREASFHSMDEEFYDCAVGETIILSSQLSEEGDKAPGGAVAAKKSGDWWKRRPKMSEKVDKAPIGAAEKQESGDRRKRRPKMGSAVIVAVLVGVLVVLPILGNFFARAVAGDCASLGLLRFWKDMAPIEHAKALPQSQVLLADKIAMLRLHNVRGVGSGGQPVRALSGRISMLLKGYLSSNDATEAARSLRELDDAHFHHELVYEAIVMALESMQENVENATCLLLHSMSNSCLVTQKIQRGFVRVFEDLPDICIDSPPAYSLIDRFVTHRHGGITDDVVRQVPIPGRRLLLGEGDDWKVGDDIL